MQEFDSTMNYFTPRAQQVLALARQEADRFIHNFVGTEHVLLGLIKLGQGSGVNVLRKMGLDLEAVRSEVEKQVGSGPDQKMIGLIPYTPRVKRILALAAKEAKALNHNYVGTEHLLLGLLREGDGVAARVLKNLRVETDQVRQEILKELDPNSNSGMPGAQVPVLRDEVSKLVRGVVDIDKRYDIYCREKTEEVVYRNALFKGIKRLLPEKEDDLFAQFIEIEQANGQVMNVARLSVVKFCESGASADAGSISKNG